MIKSLFDTDFYKITMMQVALYYFPSVHVEYKFICRTQNVSLLPYLKRIKKEVHNLCNLKVTKEDIAFLWRLPYFDKSFLQFLEGFSLKERYIEIKDLYKIVDKLEQRIATLEKVLASHAKCIGEMRENNNEQS